MKFWTNRIPTGSNKSFNDIVEKIAAGNSQIKTASAPAAPEVKVADKVEPCNEDNKMRKNVHGPEGSPADGNGEPEKDGENKTVEAQVMAPKPAAKPVARPAAPVAAKPAVPAQKPVAAKPAAPVAKPAVAKPAAAVPGQKPAAPVVAKPVAKPAVAPMAKKPVAPVATPALAEGETEVKVAEGNAKQDNGSEGEEKNKGKFPEPDREQMYKQEPQEDGGAKTEKEAKSDKFTKIANLNPKAKNWLKKYWSMLYPSGYADSMVQDK